MRVIRNIFILKQAAVLYTLIYMYVQCVGYVLCIFFRKEQVFQLLRPSSFSMNVVMGVMIGS